MKKLLLTLAIGFFPFISSLAANGTFKKVTDTSTLKAGDQIIVVANSTAVMGAQNGTYRSVVTVTKSDNITDPKDVAVVTLESSGNPDFPFYLNAKEDNGSNGYIGVTGKGNVTTKTEIPTDATSYSYQITAAGFKSAGKYSLQLNNSAKPQRFAGYAGTQINATPYILVSSKDPAGLAFPKESYQVNLGEDFPSPELYNPNGLAVTYASENAEVATVDASGNVTIVGAGTTTISATSEETDKYAAGSASYTLTVIDPNAPVPTDATFDFTKANAYGILTSTTDFTKGNLSIAEGIVSLGYEYKSGSGYRIYGTTSYELRIQAGKNGASAGNLTISVPENYLISSIEFDGEAVGTGVFGFTDGKYTGSSKIGTWSPENGKYNTVTATIKAQAKVRTIKVSYVELKPAKMPVVSHDKNQVTITHEEKDAKIYYTVDGSDVDVANATLYEAPFAITKTTTVNAVAVVEGKANSAQNVYEAEYIAAPTATWESKNTEEHHASGVLDAPTMNLDGIHGGIIITITAPEGCALWYSLTQGESNSITKAPAMKANQDKAVNVPLTKVESGKATDILVQKHGKLTYYSENAKGKQSHDVVVNFSGETGVEDIIADENNGEVEFFNLQGVRVANPENGVYIRRQGNKATKVLVK